MATKHWTGGAAAVAQQFDGSIDTVDATPSNDTFTISIGGASVSVPGDTDVTTTAANLAAAANASTHGAFAALTWTDATGALTALSDSAGLEHDLPVLSVTGGTGTVTTFAETTANAGPHVFGLADNWSGGVAPANGDTLIYGNSNVPCLFGLANPALTGIDLVIEHGYTGQIGLDPGVLLLDQDQGSDTGSEYRPTALAAAFASITIGVDYQTGAATGSNRLRIDNLAAGASSTIIHKTASQGQGTRQPVELNYASASADIEIREALGGVGLGTLTPSTTGTVGSISASGDGAGVNLKVTAGITWTDAEIRGGNVTLDRAAGTATSLEVHGGVVTVIGTGWDITTLDALGGTIQHQGQVDVTTATIDGGTLDCSGSSQARALGALTVTDGTLVTVPESTWTTLSVPARGTLTFAA